MLFALVGLLVFSGFCDINDSPQVQSYTVDIRGEFRNKKNGTIRFEQVASSIGVHQDGFGSQVEKVQLLQCGSIALVSNRRETDSDIVKR